MNEVLLAEVVLEDSSLAELGGDIDLDNIDINELDEPLNQFESQYDTELACDDESNDLDDPISSEELNDDVKDVDENIRHVETRNSSLEGDLHPVTGVPFEYRVVEDINGEKVGGVFPEFESKFDTQLPDELVVSSDKKQFEECNSKLKDAYDNKTIDTSKFSERQLEQISDGFKPEGCTWHHHEEKGKMVLIDTETHNSTGHSGGKMIWGGGQDAR